MRVLPGSHIDLAGKLQLIPFSCRDQQSGGFLLGLWLTLLILAERSIASPASLGYMASLLSSPC